MKVTVFPATAERWADLEALFGPRGACAGCWCMYWRRPRRAFSDGQGIPNQAALRQLVEAGQVPGLLAYVDGTPAGWCAVGPREDFPVLDNSRLLKRLDDRPVWSIPCFFVARAQRGHGLTRKLISAAVAYARQQGATLIEGYPFDNQSSALRRQRLDSVTAYVGLASVFRAEGFRLAAHASETRVIMRRALRRGATHKR